jgi:hypothetical protein
MALAKMTSKISNDIVGWSSNPNDEAFHAFKLSSSHHHAVLHASGKRAILYSGSFNALLV